MSTVLVIGERPDKANALSRMLGLYGIEAIPSSREWKLAVRSLTSNNVDIVLLDVDADNDSRKLFELMRELTEIPIVARASEPNGDEAVWYLDAGAVDYMGQKMAPAVLAAKVRSLCKTAGAAPNGKAVHLGDLEIDLEARRVKRGGRDVALTPLEFRLLAALAAEPGKAMRGKALLDRVWGEDFRECSHYLRLYIGYLRQKLEDDPKRPKVILTEWGHGYRLAKDAPAPEMRRRGALRTA